jgi:hypothetical protein
VAGLGISPWARSHFGPVAEPSFPQDSLHGHPCNSFRQKQLWARGMTVGWQPHPSLDVLSSSWTSISSLSLLSGISSKVSPSIVPHPIPDQIPPPHPLSLRSPSLSPSPLISLLSLSPVGLRCPHLGTSACWVFWIL